MIALYHGVGLLSRLIQFQTRGKYSHAAWVCADGSVIEAWVSGVEHNAHLGKAHTTGTRVDLFEIKGLSWRDRKMIEELLLDELGKPYDYWAILKFLSRRAATENGKWFCSELIFAAALARGIELLARCEAWEVSPTMMGWSPRLKFVGSVVCK